MKPPSSDAEALRSEQSAPVCATNRLFVAADELGHLASVQQPVRQALRLVPRRVLGDSMVDSIRFRPVRGLKWPRISLFSVSTSSRFSSSRLPVGESARCQS